MAIIVEVLGADDRAVRTRVRTDELPLTVGRALDNDVIVEDAYVDAKHARIRLDADGKIVIEDLGSVNGLLLVGRRGHSERHLRVVASGGMEVRLGRTILRFRDPSEPVPPALPDAPARARDDRTGFSSLLASRSFRILMPIAAAALAGTQAWLTSYERSAASDVLAAVLAFVVLAGVWAGVWATAARIVVGRFNYGAHFAIISGALLVGVLAFELDDWLAFLLPTVQPGLLAGTLMIGLTAAAVASHLALSSTMSRSRRWRTGALISAIVVGFGAVAAVVDDASFSDVATFNAALKPVVATWPAALDLSGFEAAAQDVRRSVDELATK